MTHGIKNQTISEKDSLAIDKMSSKDPSFVRFLDKRTYKTLLFTIQDKCLDFIGSQVVNRKFNKLNQDRKNSFMSRFKNNGVGKRVKIYNGENTFPFNGFSFYKIVYKGDYPKPLIRAYKKMNTLNKEVPRNKFEENRKNNKGVL